MKRLVSTLNLPKEDWLRYRKCGITGTDAGAILGLNPYGKSIRKIICYRLQRSSGSQKVRQHGTEICKLGVCLGRGEEVVSCCQL